MSLNGFELLASGRGQRLERWSDRVILRPETSAIWPWPQGVVLPDWDGLYHGNSASGGHWEWRSSLPESASVHFGRLSFHIRPTASKHLGLFPEQAANWDWIMGMIRQVSTGSPPPRILNLFGYTGGATLAAASAGCAVTHVDSSKAMVTWCSENARLSGMESLPIRYIVEDVLTFLQRELRRGKKYDAVVMDPPAFGRAKGGGLWKLSEHLPSLVDSVHQILSDNPLFLLLNIYSDNLGGLPLDRIAETLNLHGGITVEEPLGLVGTMDGKYLPCGTAYRWSAV